MNRSRQPRGIPTGGEFAVESRTETIAQLDDTPALAALVCDAYRGWGPAQNELAERFAMPAEEACEHAVRVVGARVEARAHELAGITAEQVRDRHVARVASEDVDDAVERGVARALALREEIAAETSPRRKSVLLLEHAELTGTSGVFFDSELTNMVRAHELRKLRAGTDATTRLDLAKLSLAYADALEEIRPLGGAVQTDEKTPKGLAAALNDASQVLPSEWIEESNMSDPLRARKVTGRGNYSDAHLNRVKKRIPKQVTAPLAVVELHPEEYRITDRVDTPGSGLVTATCMEVRYVREDSPGKPYGNGWELEEINGRQVWRRPQTAMVSVGIEKVPSTISTTSDESTTLHEMTHRCEAVVPAIPAMERDFLTRVHKEAGEPRSASLKSTSSSMRSSERYLPVGLPRPYMSKVYSDNGKIEGQYFEVMTTGVEAIFHGRYGGLVGAGAPEHPEMRHFVLGVLASA